MQNDAGGRKPDLRKDSPNHGLAAKTGLIDAQWLAKHLPARRPDFVAGDRGESLLARLGREPTGAFPLDAVRPFAKPGAESFEGGS
jgi:hypothetical protein